jgi:hypothetical protein
MKVSPPNKVCKRCDALGANGADDVIQIEHAITDDLPDGTPTLPGFTEDRIYWALVARLCDGRTRWRRIYLQPNTALRIGPGSGL